MIGDLEIDLEAFNRQPQKRWTLLIWPPLRRGSGEINLPLVVTRCLHKLWLRLHGIISVSHCLMLGDNRFQCPGQRERCTFRGPG